MESAGQKCHGECMTEMSWRVQDRNVVECMMEMSWRVHDGNVMESA